MRAVAILLAMLAVSTMVSSARCVVRCIEPPDHPPCHHQNPSKEAPAQPPCDSVMVAGEAPNSRVAISTLSLGSIASVDSATRSSLTPAPYGIVAESRERPPEFAHAAGLVVLRI